MPRLFRCWRGRGGRRPAAPPRAACESPPPPGSPPAPPPADPGWRGVRRDCSGCWRGRGGRRRAAPPRAACGISTASWLAASASSRRPRLARRLPNVPIWAANVQRRFALDVGRCLGAASRSGPTSITRQARHAIGNGERQIHQGQRLEGQTGVDGAGLPRPCPRSAGQLFREAAGGVNGHGDQFGGEGADVSARTVSSIACAGPTVPAPCSRCVAR